MSEDKQREAYLKANGQHLRHARFKYIKLKSLTWWAAFVPLAAGIFIALEPVHGLSAWAEAVGNGFSDANPAVLINLGLAGIGLRGAL